MREPRLTLPCSKSDSRDGSSSAEGKERKREKEFSSRLEREGSEEMEEGEEREDSLELERGRESHVVS